METFAEWLSKHAPVNSSSRIEWLAHGPRNHVTSFRGYIINGHRFYTIDVERSTQDNGVSIEADTICQSNANDNSHIVGRLSYYEVIRDIILLDYYSFKVSVFRCDWANPRTDIKIEDGFTLVNLHQGLKTFENDPFILASQAKQVLKFQCPMSWNKKEIMECPPESQNTTNIVDDAISIVFGKEAWGRVCGMGFGVTPSKVGASVQTSGTVQQLQTIITSCGICSDVGNEFGSNNDINIGANKSSDFGHISQSNLKNVSHGDIPINAKCKLFHWCVDELVVAEGRIASIDPNTKVHHTILGGSCWKVWVDKDDADGGRASGLDQAAISSYPKFPFAAAKGGDPLCSICLCEYREGEMLRMLPDCGHCFHLLCVDVWLQLNASCPVCRNSPLPTPVQTPISTPLSELAPLAQFVADRRRR
ncbi:hypothetical protein ZIOFF_012325 [Zingiber officinale]|uniref:RING-type domain-containing protein n=1 Tax=Zingiber officinale TaxID=94328 RepID=A0A8J5M3B7_ZINOF|nr:hypothetical protein ZIOFF_012325 [Zingiber officinale]